MFCFYFLKILKIMYRVRNFDHGTLPGYIPQPEECSRIFRRILVIFRSLSNLKHLTNWTKKRISIEKLNHNPQLPAWSSCIMNEIQMSDTLHPLIFLFHFLLTYNFIHTTIIIINIYLWWFDNLMCVLHAHVQCSQ